MEKRNKTKSLKKGSKVILIAILTFLMCLALSACGVMASNGKDNLVVDNGEVEMAEANYASGGQLRFPSAALTSAKSIVNATGNGTVAVNGSFVAEAGYVYYFQVYGGKGGIGSTSASGVPATSSSGGYGGYGGYSHGYYDMTSAVANQTLYYYVGGAGKDRPVGTANGGGYNGGGNAAGTANSRYNGAGGGASHIATKDGLLSTLSGYKTNVLIVAGGGGGGSSHQGNNGGHGGGEYGQQGSTGNNSTVYNGQYLTTVNGAAGGGGGPSSGGAVSNTSQGQAGTFGKGGDFTYASCGGGAGGGGWYGGGAGYSDSGGSGGGSGYVGGVQYLSGQSGSMMTSAANNAQGKIIVTRYAAVNMKNPEIGVSGSTVATSLIRGVPITIANSLMATEPINTSTALTYVVTDDLYLDANFATSATAKGYVTVTGSSTSIKVTPKLSMLNTTLYAKMHCSNPNFDIGIPVTFTTTDQAWAPQGVYNDSNQIYNNITISGKEKLANFGTPNKTGAGNVPSSPNEENLVYNPNSNAVRTLYIRKPIGTNSTLQINASDIYFTF